MYIHYLLDNCHMTVWSRCHMTCWVESSHSSHHPDKFVGLAPCESENIIFLIWHVTTQSKCHVILWTGSPYPKSSPLSLGSIGLVKVKIQRFWLVTWPHGWCVTWLCGWGTLILSHHPATFGVHRPRESGDVTFLISHVTTISIWVSCDFVGGVSSSQPS